MRLDGVLFFPVTPFGPDGGLAEAILARHVSEGVAAGAGGVFAACGTGEFNALDLDEYTRVVATSATALTTSGTATAVTATSGTIGTTATTGTARPRTRSTNHRLTRANARPPSAERTAGCSP
ncbi:dihydrodipicolinate synthase family protein [Nonomuraea insulae]|uniref:Dihydrodipicolinate synthase family protein n=1 Tax=Nonomuraea insulae TaxID=1616787 RepID=A0ABW1CJR0_9ACTN